MNKQLIIITAITILTTGVADGRTHYRHYDREYNRRHLLSRIERSGIPSDYSRRKEKVWSAGVAPAPVHYIPLSAILGSMQPRYLSVDYPPFRSLPDIYTGIPQGIKPVVPIITGVDEGLKQLVQGFAAFFALLFAMAVVPAFFDKQRSK